MIPPIDFFSNFPLNETELTYERKLQGLLNEELSLDLFKTLDGCLSYLETAPLLTQDRLAPLFLQAQNGYFRRLQTELLAIDDAHIKSNHDKILCTGKETLPEWGTAFVSGFLEIYTNANDDILLYEWLEDFCFIPKPTTLSYFYKRTSNLFYPPKFPDEDDQIFAKLKEKALERTIDPGTLDQIEALYERVSSLPEETPEIIWKHPVSLLKRDYQERIYIIVEVAAANLSSWPPPAEEDLSGPLIQSLYAMIDRCRGSREEALITEHLEEIFSNS